MLLGGPLEQSFSSTALGCVSCLGQFPSLEDQVMPAPLGEISAGGPVSRSDGGGAQACESLSDRVFPGGRVTPGTCLHASVPAECPHRVLPGVPGLPLGRW